MKSFESVTAAPRLKNPEKERKSVISWLARVNPAIIPAAFAMAMSASAEVQAESIEEINGQNWLQGVETLRESVMNGETEVGAIFLIGEDGNQHWFSIGKGEATAVHYQIDNVEQSVNRYTEVTGEEVDRVCNAHTHNLEAMVAGGLISDEELAHYQVVGYGPSYPPSLVDINLYQEVRISSALGDVPHFTTVFDAQGVWYSRVPTAADYAAFPNIQAEKDYIREVDLLVFGDANNEYAGAIVTEALRSLEDTALEELLATYGQPHDVELIAHMKRILPEDVRITIESLLVNLLRENKDPNYPLISELLSNDADRNFYHTYLETILSDSDNQFYNDVKERWFESSRTGQFDESLLPQVYEAFIRQNAFVRFVPYAQIPNEPPCAGPDYRIE